MECCAASQPPIRTVMQWWEGGATRDVAMGDVRRLREGLRCAIGVAVRAPVLAFATVKPRSLDLIWTPPPGSLHAVRSRRPHQSTTHARARASPTSRPAPRLAPAEGVLIATGRRASGRRRAPCAAAEQTLLTSIERAEPLQLYGEFCMSRDSTAGVVGYGPPSCRAAVRAR